MTDRIQLIVLLVVSGLIVFPCSSQANTDEAPKRPNLIVILADDLGFSDIGCYGGEIKTPNLDSLAANGIRYTQFYNTARCWPTRSSLMTGYYAQQIRRDRIPGKSWGGGRGRRPEWAPLVSKNLTSLGYRCYHSGKWHIDGKVLDNGFQHSYRLNDHDRFFYPQNHLKDDKPLKPIPKIRKDFYTTTYIVDHVIECLKDHSKAYSEKPFFHFIAFNAPHFPLHAPANDINKYKGVYANGWEAIRQARWKKIQSLQLLDCELSKTERDLGPPYRFPQHLAKLGDGEVDRPQPWNQLNESQQNFQEAKMMVHAAMVDRMDQEIGRLVRHLKDTEQFENTLILFLSDNGASAEIMVRGDGHDREASPGSGKSYLCLGPGWSTVSNTPFRKHKTWVHEGGISTPLIAHWPKGIAARGELRTAPGHVIDIWPTLMAVAAQSKAPSASAQKTVAPQRPGISLVNTFQKDIKNRERQIWWSHEGHRALRQGRWKIVSTKQTKWELFDLSVDRAETRNLASEKPELVKKLAAQWNQLTEDFGKQSKPTTLRKNR